MKRPSVSSLVAICAVILPGLFFLSGCSKDDAKPSEIDLSNPNEVAKSLKVENATYITGNFPIPSSSETAPVLSESGLTPLVTIQGSKLIISGNLSDGSAAGFYIKIKDADGYFKISSTSATGRFATKFSHRTKGIFSSERTQSDSDPSFSIEVPENIKPGEFCISYCVYDADNQISNAISQCITIQELGGNSEASFIANKQWSYYSSLDYKNNIVTSGDTVGSWPVYSKYQAYIPCDDSSMVIEAFDSYRINYEYITFEPKGALAISGEEDNVYLDYEQSDCEAVYKNETVSIDFTGAWSYNSSTKQLVLLYNDVLDNSTDYETVVEKYDVSLVGGNLILKTTSPDEDNEYSVVTLKPKD